MRDDSFLDRSRFSATKDDFGKPKIELNQHLLKPTKPKKFKLNTSTSVIGQDTESSVLNIKNSQLNLRVPGSPPKKITMKKIAAPRRG